MVRGNSTDDRAERGRVGWKNYWFVVQAGGREMLKRVGLDHNEDLEIKQQ